MESFPLFSKLTELKMNELINIKPKWKVHTKGVQLFSTQINTILLTLISFFCFVDPTLHGSQVLI